MAKLYFGFLVISLLSLGIFAETNTDVNTNVKEIKPNDEPTHRKRDISHGLGFTGGIASLGGLGLGLGVSGYAPAYGGAYSSPLLLGGGAVVGAGTLGSTLVGSHASAYGGAYSSPLLLGGGAVVGAGTLGSTLVGSPANLAAAPLGVSGSAPLFSSGHLVSSGSPIISSGSVLASSPHILSSGSVLSGGIVASAPPVISSVPTTVAIPGPTITRNILQTVQQPVPVAVPVDRPVPIHIPRPVAVPVPQPYPVTVTKHVPVPHPVAVPVDRPYPVTITKHVPVPQPYAVPQPYPVPVSAPLTSVHVGSPAISVAPSIESTGSLGLAHGISALGLGHSGISGISGISTLGGINALGLGHSGLSFGLGASYAPSYASLATPYLSSSALKVIPAPALGSIHLTGPIRHGGISLGIIKTVSSPHKYFSKW